MDRSGRWLNRVGSVRVSLRILGPDGAVAAGAHVTVPWSERPFPETVYIADDEGIVRLQLEPGAYRIRAQDRRGLSAETEARVEAADVELKLRLGNA